MARKKTAVAEESPYRAVNEQVERGDTLTIEDVRKFIADAKKKRQDWLNIAERSWAEVKKRNRKGQLYGGNDLDRARRWAKFPLWWSCLKIRQPLTLARLPLPIIKDTQGDDPIGRTACVIGERFIRGILKTFNAFDEFRAANDDFLVTDFGWGRVYYRKEECYEEEKVRLQAIQMQVGGVDLPEGVQPAPEIEEQRQQQPITVFITPEGDEVPQEQVLADEFGPYIKTGEQVLIENEEVYFEAGLYSNLYVDDVVRWNKCTRLAFEYQYSYREFKEKFGQSALDKLARGDIDDHRLGKPITCFEYHDKFLKEVRFLAENSSDFFQPKGMTPTELVEVGEVDNSDLYGLSGFFPCTAPLIENAPTDEFWPTPEYFQVADLLENIHNIVSRMILLTKAIRVRFFFDSSVPVLKQLIGETGEGGGIGVPNLEQSLMNAKGSLSNLVAYFPVDEMIQGLNNMYTGFEQGLNMFYQATGLSELIRGQTSDADKTYGERQLEGKFALNRIEPRQGKVQEWIKDNYQILMEMGFKNFSDETVDQYITPQTLDKEDKDRYEPALELLKANKRSRFRMDFETDSTIAINEQWRKKQATDLANTLTKAMESTAKVAETQPELAATELKVLKHLIGEFSDGKLFVDEIQESIQQVIDRVAQPKAPEPNLDLEKLKLDGQRMGADLGFKRLQLESNINLEYAKLQAKSQQDAIQNQIQQLKLQIDSGATQEELQLSIAKVQNDIAQGWEELSLKKEALLASVQAEVGKKEMERMRTILDARVKAQEMSLAEADQALRAFEVEMFAKDTHASLQERIATEQRLQEEHGVNVEAKQVDAMATLMDALKTEPPKAAPVSIDLSKTIHVKPTTKKEPKKK